MKSLIIQIGKFGVVGAICFLIDWGVLVFLTEGMEFHYLLSGGISFLVSVAVNYMLSRRFVFTMGKQKNRGQEFMLFLILSAVGLGINEAAMYVLVEQGEIHYMISKIIATVIVMIYNFLSRKIVLEAKGI